MLGAVTAAPFGEGAHAARRGRDFPAPQGRKVDYAIDLVGSSRYDPSVKFVWDPEKDEANRRKHGLGFEEARDLFTSGVDYLEIFDDEHSEQEERFIAIGPIKRGIIVVVWTEWEGDDVRIISARVASANECELFHRHMGG